jgi:glycosyltransferase involved in cell wall biosynthesis
VSEKAQSQLNIVLLAPAIADYCVEYANALTEHARVTMLAPARTFSGHASYVDQAVDLRLLDWPRHRSPSNVLFIPRLVQLVRAAHPSVIHILSEGVVWLNLALPFLHRSALVTTMHDVAYHPGDRMSQHVPRCFVDHLLARSDNVIVHGDALKREAVHRYPGLAARLRVLPHLQLRRYIEIADRAGMRRDTDPVVRILFFGRIFAYKGLDVLIRSIPRVVERHPGIRVIIAGEGDSMIGYRQIILEPALFDIRNRHIPDDETASLFTDADIVVLPYLEASQSGVLAIANAFGKPVIVTDVGELGRSVEHDRTGLVIPPGDADALADAIALLAADKALRDRLGAAGRAAAERTASSSVVAAQAIEIYRNIARPTA